MSRTSEVVATRFEALRVDGQGPCRPASISATCFAKFEVTGTPRFTPLAPSWLKARVRDDRQAMAPEVLEAHEVLPDLADRVHGESGRKGLVSLIGNSSGYTRPYSSLVPMTRNLGGGDFSRIPRARSRLASRLFVETVSADVCAATCPRSSEDRQMDDVSRRALLPRETAHRERCLAGRPVDESWMFPGDARMFSARLRQATALGCPCYPRAIGSGMG